MGHHHAFGDDAALVDAVPRRLGGADGRNGRHEVQEVYDED